MSTETAIHLPLRPNRNVIRDNDQIIDEADNQDNSPASPIRSQTIQLHNQPPQPSLIAESTIPSTPTIPTLNLPIPPISLSTHTPSKSSKISILPKRQNSLEGELSIPNSVKDLQNLASSIGYNNTLKPNLLPSLGQSTLTLKPGHLGFIPNDRKELGGSLLSFGGQLKKLDKSFIEQYLNTQGSSERRNSSRSSSTVGGGGGGIGKRGIDEVEVEWCFYCGKESLRGDMRLKEVQMNLGDVEETREPGKDEKNGGIEDVRGDGTWQWVCKDDCRV